jgi:hypothetical protein
VEVWWTESEDLYQESKCALLHLAKERRTDPELDCGDVDSASTIAQGRPSLYCCTWEREANLELDCEAWIELAQMPDSAQLYLGRKGGVSGVGL